MYATIFAAQSLSGVVVGRSFPDSLARLTGAGGFVLSILLWALFPLVCLLVFLLLAQKPRMSEKE